LRQRGRGEAGYPTEGGSREGGRKGSHPTAAGARAGGREGSRPPSSGARHIEKCRFAVFLFLFFLPGSSSPRLCCSCGNPGAVDGGRDFQRLWEGPGAGGRWPGAFHIRSASTAWEGESFACPGGSWESLWPRPGLRAALHGPVQTCVRVCVAACGLACRPACGLPEPRADLRAALREPRAALRGRSCGPHPPPPPSDQLSRGW
jgi:hypothetical protein